MVSKNNLNSYSEYADFTDLTEKVFFPEDFQNSGFGNQSIQWTTGQAHFVIHLKEFSNSKDCFLKTYNNTDRVHISIPQITNIIGCSIAQRVHIRCRHTILAHLFFSDFSFPSLFSYSPRLSLSLSHSPLSLSL